MTFRADTAERRLAIYAGLHSRNRVVAILRVGLPMLGILVFLIFIAQIFLASLATQFGIGQIHFNGDTVMVDTPSYSGVMANGDVYKVSAEGAATAVTDLNVIDLTNGVLLLNKVDGTQMTARAAASAFDTISQILTIPGLAEVADSTGNSGTLRQVVVDMPGQGLKATGPVMLHLRDGAVINSNGLTYSARTGLWDFGKATLTVPEAAAASDEASAGATP